MKSGTVITIGVILGWVAAHFIYQWLFGAQNWSAAIERSFFTTIAQIALWLALRRDLLSPTDQS
jgi:hypothetical protein